MRRRAKATTSERELVLALTASGRPVVLETLAIWRRHGLLPAFASQGTGAGRTYYWDNEDIVPRASAAFDLMERYCQVDMALCALWLQGHAVPGGKLRRAWLHHGKVRRRWHLQTAIGDGAASPRLKSQGPSGILLQATRLLGNALPPDKRTETAIERAAARFTGAADAGLWSWLQMAGMALEASALIEEADDKRLAEAQRYLSLAATVLGDCADEAQAWKNWLAERAGPPLVLVILALLRSGQRGVLDAMARQIEDGAGRQIMPTRPLRRHAMA